MTATDEAAGEGEAGGGTGQVPAGDRLLAGATVQKVDVAPELAVLRVRAPGHTFHVVIAAGKTAASGVGITVAKPLRGGALFTATLSEKLRWRARLEGAKVVGIAARRVLLAREGALFVIEAPAAHGARLVLREALLEDALGDAAAPADAVDLWLARGDALARSFGEDALAARVKDVQRALAKAVARVERRVAAIEADLARIGEADGIASQAAAFVAVASRAPRGARSIAVTDWSTGEARELTLPLDPARSAREQLDAMFKRARRLKLGARIARQRLVDAEAAWERVGALAVEARAIASFDEAEAIAKAARAAAPRDFALGNASAGLGAKAKGAGAATRASLPYKAFRSAAGDRILVGRGAAHNDTLTLKVARPHDLWLHAKGRTGAHVVVPLEKNRSPEAELLVDAAHLAAHFSEAREEGTVEVQYTPRRYLRKPKGAAPGAVMVDREKVLVLRVERERLARLLASEELG